MSHVYIYSGLCGAFIVIYKLLRGLLVEFYEKLGTAIAIIGCIISVFDKQASKINDTEVNETFEPNNNILYGDLIAVGASCFAVIFFAFNKET